MADGHQDVEVPVMTTVRPSDEARRAHATATFGVAGARPRTVGFRGLDTAPIDATDVRRA